jgi:hypothetical protein
MKIVRKTVPLAVLAAGLITGLALIASWLSGGFGAPAQASTPIVVGYDMNTVGNTCPGDGVHDCTLGPIDACVMIPSGGGDITFDVYLHSLPAGPSGFAGFQYHTGEKNNLTVGTVTAYTHYTLINLICQAPGSCIGFDDPQPGPLPGWAASVADLGGIEYNPPFTKGVLSRVSATIPAGTPNGVYYLTINQLSVLDYNANNYCNPASPNYVGCVKWDGWNGHGLIAKGVPCPNPPVGGIAELPDVSDSSASNYVAMAGITALTLASLSASAWYARRRWVRR